MKKQKLSTLAMLMIAIVFKTFSQTPPAIEWQKSYGGTDAEIAYAITQTSDGGYAFAGFAHSNNGDVTLAHTGDDEYWIVKVNSTGTIQWQKSYGSNKGEQAYAMKQTSDGGYILVGQTNTNANTGDITGIHNTNGSLDMWVVKISSTGTIEWKKTLGGTGDEVGYSVEQTSDGGYIIAGLSSSNNGDVSGNHGGYDYWLVKLTSSGGISWQKSFGGSNDDRASCVKQTSDGGYILCGRSNTNNDGNVTGNHGNNDFWIVKTDGSGNLSWQKSFGGSGEEFATSIIQTSDGNYAVVGYTASSNSGDVTGNRNVTTTECPFPWDPGFCFTNSQDYYDYWLIKMNSSGTMQWQQYYGGTNHDKATSLVQTSDGGYIIAGYVESTDGQVTGHHGGQDFWVIKANSSGTLQWQKAMGGSGNEQANSLALTSDGGYIVAGETAYGINGDITVNHGDHDMWVVKLASSCTPTTSTTTVSSCGNYPWNGTTYTTSGSYTIHLTNAGGCDSAATLVLTVNNSPVTPSVSISSTTSPICSGSSATFTASGTNPGPGPVYQWKKNGTNVGSGTSITFTAGTLTTGDVISCTLTANNSCQTTATANSNNITVSVLASPAIGTSTISPSIMCTIGGTRNVNNSNTSGGGVWSSSNSRIVTVATISGATGVVTAQGNGTATLTYTKTAANTCTSVASVNVTVDAVAAINTISGVSSMCKGSSTTLTTASTGGVWSSQNVYASVNSGGLVTGDNAGPAVITYTVTNGNGCSASASKNITVNTIPAVPSIGYAAGSINPQIGAGGGFCNNKSFTLEGTPGGGTWSSTGGVTVNPSSGAAATVSLGAASVTYTITSSGCSNSRTITGNVVTCASRGVNTNVLAGNDTKFTLYPNPAKTFISLNVYQLMGSGTIVVTDLYGKQVKQQSLSMGNNTIDVSRLAKGMYMVSVITSDGKKTEKLIVE